MTPPTGARLATAGPAGVQARPPGAEPRPGRDPRLAAALAPLDRSPLRLLLIFLLLLLSAVAWRKGTYYSGGLDGVVVIKAALNVVAVALALTAPQRGTPWNRYAAGPLPWFGLYLLLSGVGAVLAGNGLATGVLIARIVLITITIVLVFSRYRSVQVLSALMTAMLLLAGFTSVTGIGSLASEGRLYGGIPPVNANEIALLVSLPFLTLVWRCIVRVAGWRDIVTMPILLAVVWATGTRTGLAALLLATVLVVLLSTRLPSYLFSLGLLAVPTALGIALYTPVLTQYATRGDASSMLTLNSRTVAWRAALSFPDTAVQDMLGVGLSVKKIPVSAMYRNEQILDSTWVSALVQAGKVGTIVLALLVLVTLVRTACSKLPWRSLCLSGLALLTLISVLESGLFDASSSLIAFLCLAFGAQLDPHEGDSG